MQPILKIDLTRGETAEISAPPEWERHYLGGASLAARLLYPELVPDLVPLSEAAPLMILTGPLTGTAGPTVGRFVVCGRSPATGLWAESNCGGFWGPELRFCGYDGLWLTGRADRPVYLWLADGRLEVRQAQAVWGQDTYAAQETIRTEIGVPNARVLTIGPAGENGVLFAGLFCDHGRTAGRTGLGAVMGAKNLKAIAVKGTGKIPLASPEAFASLRGTANRMLKADNIAQVTHALGTAGVADYADYLGSMPKKYYHQATMDGVDKISGATMTETILKGFSTCHGCVIACGRVVDLGDGIRRKGPEYETAVGFGPNLLNDDLAEIVRLNEICDRYGMDTISASNTIGLAYHLYEKGLLSEAEVGFPLAWGDTQAAGRLLDLIARREAIGAFMADGARRFGAHFGAEQEAVQVNGLEVAYHDPRGVSGMALVYATSPRGACHNRSDYFFVDWGQAETSLGLEFLDRLGGAEKAANVARHQDWRTVCDSLVLCLFGNLPVEMVVDLVNAACGFGLSVTGLLQSGERAWNLKRAINNRLGLTQVNDRLPKTLLEPYADGPAAGYVPPLEAMLAAYYEARGWDRRTGRPGREKLQALGLADVAGDLWESG
ncbi:MAG: aldehyde ferredoxin oxidoreductase family protein [Anaerolineales bacterium]|nr:aldehyde ferredoxin oxidoreductase family protein [Anaerolineales bacterium]